MAEETEIQIPSTVEALLSDLKSRENVYNLTRFETFRVEPHEDGIRIQGTEGSHNRELKMEGLKFYQFAGVPENIQGKLTRNLLASVAQELLHTSQAGRFSVLTAGGDPVCFQTFAAPYVSPASVLEVLLQTKPFSDSRWAIGDLNVAPDHVDIDIFTDNVIATPKVGDIVRMGLHMSLYDSMYRPTVVEGFTHRVFCENGAQMRYNNRSFAIHADASAQAVREQIIQRAGRIMAELPAIVERSGQQLIATPVENPVVAINRIAEELGQDGRVIRNVDAIQEAFAQEPGNTMWEVQNAFSRAARGLQTYEARASLRENAGKIMSRASSNRCTGCFRVTR